MPDSTPSANHSTGPRTPGGKATSSMNALTHGLTAKTPLLPGEDAGEFRRFVWDIVADLAPVGPVQAELAHRAAVLMWRRRRVYEAERQVLAEMEQNYWKPDEEEEGEADAGEADAGDEGADDPADDVAGLSAEDRRRLDRFILADSFATGAKDGKPTQLERLSRYEERLSRQADAAIKLLMKLQNRKEWRERQGQRARDAGDAPPRPAARLGAPAAPSAPPPPAPAQNELPATDRVEAETEPPKPWTGPPGVN